MTSSINKESHFDFLWKTAILPSIEKCKADLSTEFISKCCVKDNSLEKYKSVLCVFYKEKREWLKNLYLYNAYKTNPIDVTLDLHKIASVIVRCIIGRKFFIMDMPKALLLAKEMEKRLSLDEFKSWCVDNIYVNYKLAYLAGMGISYWHLLDDCLERDEEDNCTGRIAKEKEKLFSMLYNKNRLLLYKGNDTHGSFEVSNIMMLMKNDVNGRDFDYLAWASLFFQLQQYNYLLSKTVYPNKISEFTIDKQY